MAALPLTVSTLAWLDHRRLWATTSRNTALGAGALSTFSTSLGGQGARPSVAYRVFAPNYPLAFTAVSVGSAAAIVGAFFAHVSLLAFGLAFSRALIFVDDALSPEKPRAPYTGVSDSGQEATGGSLKAPLLVYSLLGAMGTFQDLGATPAPAPTLAYSNIKLWSPQPTLGNLNPWGLFFDRGGAHLPSFRSYLGEWRRLLDEQPLAGASKPTALAQIGKSGTGLKSLPLTSVFQKKMAHMPLRPASPHLPKSYAPYLPTSWVF